MAKSDAAPLSDSLTKAVKAVCPKCHRKYRLDERYAGRLLKCRGCGERIEIPRLLEVVRAKAALEPGVFSRSLERLKRLLSGESDEVRFRRMKEMKWLHLPLVRWVALAGILVMVISTLWVYLGSDAAKIAFGLPGGEDVAFRRLVELEEQLATSLSRVKSAADAARAAPEVRSIVEEQGDLWERISEWKLAESLTAGELQMLRTRYRDRYAKAERDVSQERIRIAKVPGANEKILSALRDEEAMSSKRIVLSGAVF